MKKNSKLRIAIVSVAVLAIAAASAQKVSIDYRLNVAKSDPAADYFSWNQPNRSVKDTFDSAIGASKYKSTAEFDAIWFDGSAVSRRQTIPNGLRNLFLFPISPRSVFAEDAFTVDQVDGGKEFQIRFVHRGVAYQATTKGKQLDSTADFSSATVADTVAGEYVVREAFRKGGTNGNKMSDLDWDKITLLHDAAAVNAEKRYTGKLRVAYNKDGVLTLKGDLALAK
jgi:hypothetical protein